MSRDVSSRRLLGLAAITCVALAAAPAAMAHARVSPAVAVSKQLQVFDLAVPTEKENAFTTEVEMTSPQGCSIDSFAPSPGWKRNVQESGSGENTTVTKVTWSGGHVPTEEDALFQFLASTDSSKSYSFKVRQTYSDGSVVDWSGPESSDTPAPVVESKSSLGGGGSSTLSIVALVVAAAAVVVAAAGLSRGRPLA